MFSLLGGILVPRSFVLYIANHDIKILFDIFSLTVVKILASGKHVVTSSVQLGSIRTYSRVLNPNLMTSLSMTST